MKKCPQCGHLDYDDANYCDRDGARLVSFREDNQELVKLKEEQDFQRWMSWIEETVSLPEKIFIERMKSLLPNTNPCASPGFFNLFFCLCFWRKQGIPLMNDVFASSKEDVGG